MISELARRGSFIPVDLHPMFFINQVADACRIGFAYLNGAAPIVGVHARAGLALLTRHERLVRDRTVHNHHALFARSEICGSEKAFRAVLTNITEDPSNAFKEGILATAIGRKFFSIVPKLLVEIRISEETFTVCKRITRQVQSFQIWTPQSQSINCIPRP